MICSRCDIDKPDKAYPQFHGERKGQVCKECRNHRDNNWQPIAGICHHCHEPIVGRPKTTKYHTDPEHPECYAAKQEHEKEQQRSYDRTAGRIWRKAREETAPAIRKKCVRCIAIGIRAGFTEAKAIARAHLVKKGNYFHCDKCHEWASNQPDEIVGW